MDTTGALYRQPATKPGGSDAGPHGPRSRSGASQSGRGAAARAASVPLTSRTPVPGSPASSVRTSRVSPHQRVTRSLSSTRCGPQMAPATADVVCCGGWPAWTVTASPASARHTAVVSPATPAPITSTSPARSVTPRR